MRPLLDTRSRSSRTQLLGFGVDHVMCLNELKLSMLAVATLCPAFLPLVANSMRSCENIMLEACSGGARASGGGGNDKEKRLE